MKPQTIRPKHRNKRLAILAFGAFAAIAGVVLLMQALGDTKQLFKNPSDIMSPGFVQGKNQIKLGGLVVMGSVERSGGLTTRFLVENFAGAQGDIPPVPVTYNGALPDLFREGQGVVIIGRMGADGIFKADTVLAKHDENYKPKMPGS